MGELGGGMVVVMLIVKGDMKVLCIDLMMIDLFELEIFEDLILVVYNEVCCKVEDK